MDEAPKPTNSVAALKAMAAAIDPSLTEKAVEATFASAMYPGPWSTVRLPDGGWWIRGSGGCIASGYIRDETIAYAIAAIPETAEEIQRLLAQNAELVGALTELVTAFVNPNDGGEFETGEVPALDKARAVLAKEPSTA